MICLGSEIDKKLFLLLQMIIYYYISGKFKSLQ